MGMAASQVRFLQLTTRKNKIGDQLRHLSMQKTSLTRDMQRVSRQYKEALETKSLKWTNNAGISYVDLSYANLMTPSLANGNKPYLITDTSGKVVVDSKYKKYAEMISSDGSPNGNWESNRIAILSELTGIPADTLNGYKTSLANLDISANNIEELREARDILASKKPIQTMYASEFVNQNAIINALAGYCTGATVNIGEGANATVALTNINNTMKSLMKNLPEEELNAFKEACDSATANANGSSVFTDTKVLYLNLIAYVNDILDNYRSNLGAGSDMFFKDEESGQYKYVKIDTTSTEYINWEKEYNAAVEKYENAVKNYNTDASTSNAILTAAQESEIAFYDQLFSGIADKGWTHNIYIEDTEYLNQMLQNNQYYITTMEPKSDENGKQYYEYTDSLASTFEHICAVNDTTIQDAAMTDYEYEKSIISQKESVIDQRMKDLETEQSAINNMLKGIEQVRNDNIERTFNIFS